MRSMAINPSNAPSTPAKEESWVSPLRSSDRPESSWPNKGREKGMVPEAYRAEGSSLLSCMTCDEVMGCYEMIRYQAADK